MMSEQQKLKKLKIRTGIFFVAVFVIAIGCAHLIQRSQENREKLKASYTDRVTTEPLSGKLKIFQKH
jgi:hypothetical protein